MQIVRRTGFFSLGKSINLREGKLEIQTPLKIALVGEGWFIIDVLIDFL